MKMFINKILTIIKTPKPKGNHTDYRAPRRTNTRKLAGRIDEENAPCNQRIRMIEADGTKHAWPSMALGAVEEGTKVRSSLEIKPIMVARQGQPKRSTSQKLKKMVHSRA